MTEEIIVKKSLGTRIKHVTLLLLGPLVIAGISAWVYLHGGRFISTDNAYIKTEILSISSNVTGMVVEVATQENEFVSAGQVLLRMDDQPYLIAVARAEANLATVRGDIESLKAELENKRLDIDKADTDLDFRSREMERIKSLYEQNSISGVLYDQAVYSRNAAEKELAEKKQSIQVVKARLIDPESATDKHPRVKQAQAELEKAKLDLSHTEVKAPVAGVIANITSQVGENVMTGASLMNLINEQKIWLAANFKETDLTYFQLGQAVTITVDTYPDAALQGHVAIITPATGSEFSLLPAQNSSGNWVKVVQRIPVIIALDDYDGSPKLASGMSAEVTVDTGHIRTLPWERDQ